MVNTENKTTVKFRGNEYAGYSITINGEVTGNKRNNVMTHTHLSFRDYVTLSLDGKSTFVQVAEAVLESFYGVSNDKSEKFVGFIDGDTSNNNIANLFWSDKRQWWLDERMNISESVTNKIIKESLIDPSLTTSEISKKINIPKGLIDLIVLDNFETKEANHQLDDTEEDSLPDSDLTVDDPFNNYVDEKFNEIFGDVMTVASAYNKIVSDELPALKYAGVSQKKIMKFVLYKYGKEVYEYFKEKHIDVATSK